MLNTFRLTLASLKDPSIGQRFVTQSWRQILRYYFLYVLLVFGIFAFLLIAFTTYYLPQLPHVMRTSVPPMDLALHKGHLTSSLTAPWKIIDSSTLTFVFDPLDQITSLEASPAGLLFNSTSSISKSQDGHLETSPYPTELDFASSRDQVLTYLESHPLQVLLMAFVLILVVVLVLLATHQIVNLVLLLVFTLGVSLFLRLRHTTPLTFASLFKLSLGLAVPSFLLSALSLFSLHPVVVISSLVLFLYLYIPALKSLLLQTSPPQTKLIPDA